MVPVPFHFDLISPYAYLAWCTVHDVVAPHGAVVRPVPVLFAALLDHHGTVGPAEVPAKRRYVFVDCLRTAAHLGVPLKAPPAHPFNPLLALRVAGLDMDDTTRRRLVDRLFAAVWAGGPGVEDPDVVGALAEEVGVPDAVARATAPEAKARLRASTEAAIAQGIFGVPTLVLDGELFWGLDSLGHLERRLAGLPPASLGELEGWLSRPPTARRPGAPGA
ncbi:MAG: 2-hydroxychromene-2-carboxylate isomerase [Alphaproteobacteria bacterium]|nr:2-hydroxychromene-2-carboxylate isomerase [Alphaproteobacteria bacterium]